MDKKLHSFLHSGLLEKYVVGDTSDEESTIVESYISNYPEVKEEYDILQEQLEIDAFANAVKAPENTLENIINTLNEKPVIELHHKRRLPFWFSVAASVAAILFAVTSYVFYSQSQNLKDENNTIADEIFDLRDDIEDNNEKLNEVMVELKKLNNPETQKYILRGNERAKDLKTVAYINPIEKTSLVDVVSLPELSDEQYYKMWAQVNDRMIDLGIIDIDKKERKLKSVPYIENALSLSITVENKDGSDVATNEKEVAQIKLESNN